MIVQYFSLIWAAVHFIKVLGFFFRCLVTKAYDDRNWSMGALFCLYFGWFFSFFFYMSFFCNAMMDVSCTCFVQRFIRSPATSSRIFCSSCPRDEI
jgi:hypothetical protein